MTAADFSENPLDMPESASPSGLSFAAYAAGVEYEHLIEIIETMVPIS